MMHHTKTRIAFTFFIFVIMYGIIALNLYCIQIRKHHFFVDLGERQYMTMVTTYPPRASILDRHGHFLAINKESIAAFITPNNMAEPARVEQFLARHFPQAHERLERNRCAPFMYVARHLSERDQQRIAHANIPDLQLLKEQRRFYPVNTTGTIVGITNIDNHGLFGLELMFEEQLAGEPTIQRLHKDARSGYFSFAQETTAQGHAGTPLITTIDGDLQFMVYEALRDTVETFQAKEGAAVVMNPKTGEILAMVTLPAFDPNDTKEIIMEHTKNKVVTEAYELGSVIKVFAALAALEERVVHPDELIDCENVATTYVDGRRINTVKDSVLGVVPFTHVIEKSNNIGIAKVVKRLDTKLYDHYIRMGFGAKTGIQFPSEREGFVNHPRQWSKQSIISLSYGYEITATLLQLAQAFSMIANDGYLIRPTLLLNELHTPESQRRYSAESITIIKQIMEGAVLRGTAKRAQIKGYRVMSKTGTANLLVNGIYNPDKNSYTCGGIVERDDYQRVIVVYVRESSRKGLYASGVAAPLFEQVAEKTLIHEKKGSL